MSSKSYYENEKLWGRSETTLLQRQVLNYLSFYCESLAQDARIADLGCGDGIILKELINRYPALKGYGIDFSSEALKHLSSDLRPCLAELTSLPFDDGFFDLCFCIDVLEHIAPDELNKVVAEIHRVCSGPVLIVSPFLESNAVRTVCPHCGCTFNPYYHLNKFSYSLWEQLSESFKDRAVQFVPFGGTKPCIPPEVGSVLIASGVYVTHQHETVCPQCGVNFSRPEPGTARELSMILGPYAAENRDSFNWIFEEMGILTLPKTGWDEYPKVGFFEGILITSRQDLNLKEKEMPALIVKSCYEIDFEDMNAVYPGADLFRSPAYIVDNGKIKKCDTSPGIHWKPGGIVGSEEPVALRLVFPPGSDKRNVTLELQFLPEVAGKLRAILNALPPKNSVQAGYIEAFPSEEPNQMVIELQPDNDFVTPYGLLVDLIWEPDLHLPCSSSGLILHKLIHRDQPIQTFLLKTGINPWPVKPSMGSSYEVDLYPDTVDSLKYGYQGRVFDLTGQLDLGREGGKNIIPMSLFGGLHEDSNGSEARSSHIFNCLVHSYRSAFNEIVEAQGKLEQLLIKTEEQINALLQELTDYKNRLEQTEIEAEEQINALLQELTDYKNRLESEVSSKFQLAANLDILELERDYLLKLIHRLKKRNIIQRIFNCN